MRERDDREAADAFWRDLHGVPPRPARRAPAIGEALPPRAPLTSRSPEPFFGDAPGERWQVVGGPGARFTGLRADDVVVRRRDDGSWNARLAGDTSPALVFSAPSQLRRDTLVLRRQPAHEPRPIAPPHEQAPAQAAQTCGFFGAHNIVRTEAQVRAAVVGSATGEWSAWHTAGRPRFETDAGMFGRLVAYCAAADGTLKPDTLLAIQAASVGAINYAPLLAAAGNAVATAAAALAPALIALAPAQPGLAAIAQRIVLQARDARRDTLPWSAAFVVTCVRGAGMSLGLETIVGVDRRHVVPAPLLLPTFAHADYTREARARRAARRRGTYQAFTPAERAPQRGDIIVVDRQATPTSGVVTLAGLGARETHGDIVIDVDLQQRRVETVGGNLSDGSENPTVGEESVRKRHYPIDARGFLIRDAPQRFTQEDNTGTVPALPDRTTHALHRRSTARIFALLSPIEDCRTPGNRT